MKRSLTTATAGLLGLIALGCGPSYPNCDDDEDCHEGELCVNGRCQQCRTDADCPAGQGCVGGACEPISGYCRSNQDCPRGQECRNNRCVAPSQNMSDLGSSQDGGGGCQLTPIYFAFDADALDGSARAAAQVNLTCARERSLGGMHLTGHCDPRGTEEYNLALGDRRARAVLEYLLSLGADVDSLSSSSMGEEMSTGTDDPSWSRDRRVDFTAR